MRPTYDELKRLWVYSYARGGFLEAEEWLNAMDKTDPKSPQFRALFCAAVVAYARPFTPSQITRKERVVPLRNVPAPSELNDTHVLVLDLRDKVIGHKDALPAEADEATPNLITIVQDATGFNLHTMQIKGMEPSISEKMKKLCAHFVKHCESQVRPIMERIGPEIRMHPVGRYELCITEPPDDWIKPIRQAR